jgi:hypothetical protein
LNKPPQRPFPALYREGALSPSNTWNNGKTMSRRAFSRRPALLIRQNPTLTGIGIPHHTRGFTLEAWRVPLDSVAVCEEKPRHAVICRQKAAKRLVKRSGLTE